jgi:hypothetical protein
MTEVFDAVGKMRSARTESLTCKVSPPTRTRLLAAMKHLGIPSQNEAVNQAIELWLKEVEQAIERWLKEVERG